MDRQLSSGARLVFNAEILTAKQMFLLQLPPALGPVGPSAMDLPFSLVMVTGQAPWSVFIAWPTYADFCQSSIMLGRKLG